MKLLLSLELSVFFHILYHYCKKKHGILQVRNAFILLRKRGARELGHARVNEQMRYTVDDIERYTELDLKVYSDIMNKMVLYMKQAKGTRNSSLPVFTTSITI